MSQSSLHCLSKSRRPSRSTLGTMTTARSRPAAPSHSCFCIKFHGSHKEFTGNVGRGSLTYQLTGRQEMLRPIQLQQQNPGNLPSLPFSLNKITEKIILKGLIFSSTFKTALGDGTVAGTNCAELSKMWPTHSTALFLDIQQESIEYGTMNYS